MRKSRHRASHVSRYFSPVFLPGLTLDSCFSLKTDKPCENGFWLCRRVQYRKEEEEKEGSHWNYILKKFGEEEKDTRRKEMIEKEKSEKKEREEKKRRRERMFVYFMNP